MFRRTSAARLVDRRLQLFGTFGFWILDLFRVSNFGFRAFLRPERRGGLVLLLSAALCVSATSAFRSSSSSALFADARTAWEVDPGHYADDPRLPELLEVAAAAREKGLARLREEWGLSPGPTPVRWRLNAAAAPAGAPGGEADPPPSDGLPDFELGRTSLDDGVVSVILPARRFLARPGTVTAVVLHECVHAVHASHARSPERYEAAPRWLREGIALVFSGEGEERLTDRIAHTVYGGAPASSFLSGVDTADVTRAEAYLAARWLRAKLGGERFARLVREIVEGESATRALTALSGMDLAALRDGAMRAAREAVRDRLPGQREQRFRALVAKMRSVPGSVTSDLEVLLAEDESGPLAGTLRYLLAREALRAPAPDERALAAARAHLEALRDAPGTLWHPEGLLLLGQCHLKEGRRAAARRAWVEITEMFGEDRAVAEQARRLLKATR